MVRALGEAGGGALEEACEERGREWGLGRWHGFPKATGGGQARAKETCQPSLE